MYFSTPVFSSLILASSAWAQMKSSNSGAATPSGSTKVHVINVSDKNGSLTYSPASTTVPVGDVVQWHFYPKNHSVVQAAFSNPCEPLSNIMPNLTTFYSGYMPVSPKDTMRPVLTMMVKTAAPFWYYCSQGDHCQDGMVGVINPYAQPNLHLISNLPSDLEHHRPAPSTGKTIDAFAQKAKTAPKSTIPTNSTLAASSSSNSTSPSPSSSPSSNNNNTAASKSASAAAAPAATTSASTFPGAANNLVCVGLTTFVGLGLALLL
ncbi:MAG: hypothetical protein Q9191_006761 [Dirinaria sp. TL-2023a]